MIRLVLCCLLLSFCLPTIGQVTLKHDWCMTKCDAAGDEKENTKILFSSRNSNDLEFRSSTTIKFPLRFVKVVGANNKYSVTNKMIDNTIDKVNIGFKGANIQFYLDKIETINSPLQIEDLSQNGYSVYNNFSNDNDIVDVITIFIFDYNHELCEVSPTSISCGRTSGFSYILSNITNNIVLSKFDLEDDKVIVHEMGHFFGLYHTFEEQQFGKDNFVEDCNIAGDCLCDTPPDPSPAFEIYVNHSKCKMIEFYHDNGNQYGPLIDNYMAYYKPCYLKSFQFTSQQLGLLNYSAKSIFRNKFSR